MPAEQPKPYGRFDFDLAAAVTQQLIAAFDALSVGPLTQSIIREIDREQGVYQLYLGTRLMYVGKAEIPLPKRLEQHRWNLSGRKNVNMSDLGFKGLIIHKNWGPSVHEDILIRRHRGKGECEWNLTGLGNHDPGRQREDTKTPERHFDAKYPIREDFVPVGIVAREWNILELLRKLKGALPFLFRYESKNFRTGSHKYNDLSIMVPREDMSIKELLKLVIVGLPAGWQATFFPGRVILYHEQRKYEHATDVIAK